MKNFAQKWMRIGIAAAMLGAVACGDDDGPTPGTDSGVDGGMTTMMDGDVPMPDTGMPGTEVMVDADITTDTTWTSDNVYVLTGQIFVRDGATLTIQPGTEIHGSADNTVLIVTATGSIDAQGTATNPIVFTSHLDVGNRAPSDWGGVVLLGRAPINVPGGTNTVEGLPPDAALGEYGGTDAAHDCGTLRYVRIEWAGFEFAMDKEFNGLTVAGCGSDTVLEHIQVHGSSDDGIEFFGGSANLKHAVISRCQDDSLDTDEGYAGNIQFLVVMQDDTGDEGWEADNLESDNGATPRSAARVYNATFIGGAADGQKGIRWRRGTAGTFANSILTNFGDDCIEVNGNASIEQANSGGLLATNSLFSECGGGTVGFVFEPSETDPASFTGDWDALNTLDMAPMLPALSLTAPNFVPPAASPAATLDTADLPTGVSFFEAADYLGAFEPGGTDWSAGWTSYPTPAE
ncbi:MAG: hypothetical protein H6722_33370 [Sandaracinus sp.]|nr:hypothetical protein [Sandaracinus sp.]MCB9617349.1 hypothetical protein [Sandaracinus sp.]